MVSAVSVTYHTELYQREPSGPFVLMWTDYDTAVQPPRQLDIRTRREASYNDDDEDWHGGDSEDDSEEGAAPVQTVSYAGFLNFY